MVMTLCFLCWCVLAGALTSLLGSGYYMHPHRHCHDTRPGSRAQDWHKDSYWGFTKPRHHSPTWIMAMYYPQKVTLDMGPTGVLPGKRSGALAEDGG